MASPKHPPYRQAERSAGEAFAVLSFARKHGIKAEEALKIMEAADGDKAKAEELVGQLKKLS